MSTASNSLPNVDPLRVLLVDDSPKFLAAATRCLQLHPWAQVVGSATSSAEALRLVDETGPDLILMDIIMPETGGLETTRIIKRRGNAPLIIAMSLHDNAEYRYHSLQAGADGFVSKSNFHDLVPDLLSKLVTTGKLEDSCSPGADELTRLAFKESEERLQLALEASAMGVVHWDRRNDVVSWSPSYGDLFSKHLGPPGGNYADLANCVHAEDLPGVEQALEDARRECRPFQHRFRVVWPDEGAVRWLLARGRFQYDEKMHAQHFTCVAMDVTEATLSLLELNQSQMRLRTIFDGNPQCITVVNDLGIIREVNPAGTTLFSVDSPEVLIGQPILQFISPEHHVQMQAFLDCVSHGQHVTSEYAIARGNGNQRWVKSQGVPMICPDNGKTSILIVSVDITEHKKTEDRLDFLAGHDAFTSLPNRTLFADRLHQAILEARRHKRPICVAMIDIDRFSFITETHGHDAANAILKECAQRIAPALRTGDTLARIGGDEFAILLADMEKAEDAPLVLQRILLTFQQPFAVNCAELFVSASVGATLFPTDDATADADTLLRNSGIALLRAQEKGRSRVEFYTTEMTIRAHEDMAIETALRYALERNELTLHYQPIIDLASGRIRSFEALLRWHHPLLGAISPARFIPIAEESGLIIPIGLWVLRTACTQLKTWQTEGNNNIRVAVNISPRQFQEPDLTDQILKILASTGLSGSCLELEITERMLLTKSDVTVGHIQRLDANGISFAIDDFGTGYSSLSYLKRFPIKVLKIDRSFVSDVTSNSDDGAIVRAVITMAHSLGLKTTAEGVETPEQLAFLVDSKSDAVQGYLFSRPLPAEAITLLLRKDNILQLH